MLETLYQVNNFILYFLLLEFNIIFLASYFKYDAGSKFKKNAFISILISVNFHS